MRKERVSKVVRAALLGGLSAFVAGAMPGCLDRPVTPATPNTSNIFVSAITQTAIDKIDLLFVIDNSISMQDKQRILEEAAPELVERLIHPAPVDGKQLKPVKDIHIGVISSSLGGHGADHCSPASGEAWKPTQDDKAHLMGSLQSSDPTRASTPAGYQGLGFLAWDPDNKKGGETNSVALIDAFKQQVQATGERGCGYEATLEAWYRFLVDPNPPAEVVVENGQAVPQGTDETVLSQRRAFLRPDSLVAIIMLTDENDCSVRDGGIGWMSSQADIKPGVAFHLPRSTSACASDPNSPCCQSCGVTAPNPDCATLPTLDAIHADSECLKGLHDDASDHRNLRCWDQQRRFGVDFLHPTDRYVNALKSRTVLDRDGVEQPNPLFANPGGIPRGAGLVFLAGIVGVPWQDIATPETLDDPDKLAYRRAEHVRWDWIVGDPKANTKPLDALMHEQPEPRSGTNPAKGYPIAPPSSLNPQENPINGHEYNIPNHDDLQYACIFDLVPDKPCSVPGSSCDCAGDPLTANKPLCQPPQGGAAETTQYFAKAYPGLRHLQVLKDFGANSIVASICPKFLDPTKPSYGYNPAVSAILDRLEEALPSQCLPRKLVPEDDPESPEFGKVPCAVVEARPLDGGACACDPSRGTSDLAADDPLIDAVRKQLAQLGSCDGTTNVSCADFCLCRIEQLTGDALAACQAGTATQSGYCYIDEPIAARNDNRILETCKETEKQVLSFVGDNVPASGAIGFIACAGKTL